MYIGIQNRLRSARFIVDFFCFILCIMVLNAAGACSTNRRVIKNETLDVWDGRRMRYKNLFPSKFGLGEKTEYDQIDFLKAHERKPHKYRLLADPRGGDIDRTLGYNPSEYTVQPDFKILQYPTHDVQITWIRHASFLIQIGGKYQIIIDSLLDQWDEMAGKFANYTAIEAPYAK